MQAVVGGEKHELCQLREEHQQSCLARAALPVTDGSHGLQEMPPHGRASHQERLLYTAMCGRRASLSVCPCNSCASARCREQHRGTARLETPQGQLSIGNSRQASADGGPHHDAGNDHNDAHACSAGHLQAAHPVSNRADVTSPHRDQE